MPTEATLESQRYLTEATEALKKRLALIPSLRELKYGQRLGEARARQYYAGLAIQKQAAGG